MATAAVKQVTPRESTPKSAHEVDDHKLISYTLDSLEGGVITISRQGVITSFNSVAERLLGCSSKESVGEHYTQIVPPIDGGKHFAEMVEAALVKGETFSSEEVVLSTRRHGRILVGITISQLRDDRDASLGVVVIFKNLAEIKRIREQFLRTEQMAALGYLAAGLAHELRNPLGSLQGLAELLEDDLQPDDPRRTYTETFLREIERMNTLVEDLLCFAQPPISTLERRSLTELVGESLLFASYDFQDRHIEVKTDYVSPLPEVLVDSERLARAFLNIIRNAFQATPGGGRITVATGTRERRDQDRAFVRITNTGSYIEPEARQKLFTPFFTLKKEGTGLGLSIAHQIVKGHSGYIEVNSDREEGTTFVIDLPTADSLAGNSEEPINAGSRAG